MRKALVTGLLIGVSSAVTLAGLGVANAMTTDLTLTVDGTTTALRVTGDTVAQVLADEGVSVDSQDYVSPSLDSPVANGDQIEVSHARMLTATIDGQTSTYVTTATTVGNALLMLGVNTSSAQISLPPQTEITQAAQVTVTTQNMVSLRADGSTSYFQTTADTVGQLLTARGITLGDLDRVTPAVDTAITSDLAIAVQRVVTQQQTTTVAVPFTTKSTKTSSLAAGTTKVTTKGADGQATQVWDVTLVDGVVESQTLVSQTTTKNPVAQVEQVGTGTTAASTSAAAVAAVPASGSPQDIARAMLQAQGMGNDQFTCLVNLWNRESHWNVHAANKSGAYGIPQAMPGSKMASAGPDWQNNATTQITWGLNYIKGRYGTPCAAWSHSQSTGWY